MPSNTTSHVFFYVYVLESLVDRKRYIGFTHDLRKRLEEHQNGKSIATRARRPFNLVYYEACTNELDARRRERYLKGTQGRKFLGLRLIEHGRTKASGLGG